MMSKLCNFLLAVVTLIATSNAYSTTNIISESEYFNAVKKAERCLQELGFESIRMPTSIKPMVVLEISLSDQVTDESYEQEVERVNRCLAVYLEPIEEQFFEQLTSDES